MPPSEPHTSELERRQQLRFRLRNDLLIDAQILDGKRVYNIKDPVSLRYHQFQEKEYFLIRLMDGQQRLEDIRKRFELHYAPERLRLEDLEAFAQQLILVGLVASDSPTTGHILIEQRHKQRRRALFRALTSVLFIKLPVADPDRLLVQILRWTGWIFTPGFLALSVGVILAALLLVGTHLNGFRDRLPDLSAFFSFRMAFTLWVAIALAKTVHEFGHGLTCRAFGGEVHEMGVLLLCLSPSLYCNVSDSVMVGDKWRRMLICFAGIYVELMIAAVATFIWWYTPGALIVNHLALSLMLVCSISTVVFNANPLLRFDGYYMLATWLEIPDFQEQANRYVRNLFLTHGLGMELHPGPPLPPLRPIIYAVYAVASYVYRWMITWGILWFLYQFLRPYKLGTVGALLALGVAALMVGGPLFRLVKGLHQRGWRLPEMKPKRVVACATLAIAVLLFLFTVPLPISRVRQDALVQVRRGSKEAVFVNTAGVLTRLHVRDGQHVNQDDILAELTNLELERQLEQARSEHDIRAVHLRALIDQARDITDPQRRGKLGVDIAQVTGERKSFAQQVKVFEELRTHLTLRAPRSGVVIGPPRKEEIGKFWEKDLALPFCSVGDLDQLEALVPVSPTEHRRLVQDQDALGPLKATIHVYGRGMECWAGNLLSIPESDAKQVPVGLTQRGGGPLAVKAKSAGNTYAPQDQCYLIGVAIQNSDSALRPGSLAQVQIHCRWRTAAWWFWHIFSTTFERGI
jgi:putative peptide zinc metalloprotease protein